jgi:transcriptional regulator of acetoin/glycerol metabolism
VRELRSYLEQLVILRVPPPLPDATAPSTPEADAAAESALLAGLGRLPLRLAKGELCERFERRYLVQLLDATGGNVAEAARRAGVDRGTLFRTIRRYGLKVGR